MFDNRAIVIEKKTCSSCKDVMAHKNFGLVHYPEVAKSLSSQVVKSLFQTVVYPETGNLDRDGS